MGNDFRFYYDATPLVEGRPEGRPELPRTMDNVKAKALDYLRETLVRGAKRRGAAAAQDRALLKRLDEVLGMWPRP
jgi:hypothetical protein